MNFGQILNLVMTLLGKREEIVSIITEAIALFNRLKNAAPQLTELVKQVGAGTTSPPMDIKWLQTSLNKVANAGIAVDGKYGQATQDAVKKFQTANNLTPDGWAGVQTQASIVAALNAVK